VFCLHEIDFGIQMNNFEYISIIWATYPNDTTVGLNESIVFYLDVIGQSQDWID
jgi:hypothetical protein